MTGPSDAAPPPSPPRAAKEERVKRFWVGDTGRAVDLVLYPNPSPDGKDRYILAGWTGWDTSYLSLNQFAQILGAPLHDVPPTPPPAPPGAAKEEAKPISLATAYLQIYPALMEAARSKGYALAIHGSLNRDMDLIAVPWTEEAADPRELLASLCEVTGLYRIYQRREDHDPICTNKPHGRLAFKLYPGGSPYIDLSIMPRRAQ